MVCLKGCYLFNPYVLCSNWVFMNYDLVLIPLCPSFDVNSPLRQSILPIFLSISTVDNHICPLAYHLLYLFLFWLDKVVQILLDYFIHIYLWFWVFSLWAVLSLPSSFFTSQQELFSVILISSEKCICFFFSSLNSKDLLNQQSNFS